MIFEIMMRVQTVLFASSLQVQIFLRNKVQLQLQHFFASNQGVSKEKKECFSGGSENANVNAKSILIQILSDGRIIVDM